MTTTPRSPLKVAAASLFASAVYYVVDGDVMRMIGMLIMCFMLVGYDEIKKDNGDE